MKSIRLDDVKERRKLKDDLRRTIERFEGWTGVKVTGVKIERTVDRQYVWDVKISFDS